MIGVPNRTHLAQLRVISDGDLFAGGKDRVVIYVHVLADGQSGRAWHINYYPPTKVGRCANCYSSVREAAEVNAFVD
jgi:hypothetical protein